MDFERLQLKEHFRLIYKHRKLIFLSTLSVLLPLALLLMLSRPKYASSISLEVSDDAITRLLTSDIDVSPDLTVGNYMDILASQSFARRVVRAMAEKSENSEE
ncbi:MAG: Wzz/FepE/Etk N-terminal domain-containing protein, partial [bacterium]